MDGAFGWWSPYLDRAESIFVVAAQNRVGHSATTTLTALLDRLEVEYCIDLRRVHAFGTSSSGWTVARLACEASGRIASVHVGASGFRVFGCAPERAVPLMAMSSGPEQGSISPSVEEWAEASECDGNRVIEDLGAGVTRTAFQGCLADIVFYVVEDAGHGFIRHECLGGDFELYCYTNEVFDQLREMERFFAEHPLPAE
jgi:poly(3-hydroxybutyrate) depolymerase